MHVVLMAITGLLVGTQAAVGFDVGEKVVVILPTVMKTTTNTSVSLVPGTTLSVQGVENDRLKVATGRVGWIDPIVVISAAKAEDYFSASIAANPQDAAALLARGKFRFEKGDQDGAIADLDESLKIRPNSEALTIRGFAWKRTGDKEKAMADFDQAIKLNPMEALAWRVRGATWASKADYEKALADYSESIRIDPDNPDSLHHRVIMLSACTDDNIRNGKQAVEDATKACEVSGWKNSLYLRGLAFANAEAGDFDAAINWYTQANQLSAAGPDETMQAHLEQLRQHKPFRMTWK